MGVFVWRRGYLRGFGWRRSFAPVFAAIALLSFVGTGGGNTDVWGHVTGFIGGLVAGAVAAATDIRWLAKSGQFIAGALAVTLVAIAWTLAV